MRLKKVEPFRNPKQQTLEELIKEGRIAGIPFFEIYSYTTGEITEFVEAKNEENRRNYQYQSIIAAKHSMLVCSNFAGEKVGSIYENFPFWTDDEINEFRLAEVYSFFENAK